VASSKEASVFHYSISREVLLSDIADIPYQDETRTSYILSPIRPSPGKAKNLIYSNQRFLGQPWRI
jgi:hypothetical protein